MRTANKILLLVTGDPAVEVAAEQGSFADMIRRAVGRSWHGTWVQLDARTDEPLGRPRTSGAPAGLPEGAAAMVITGSPASVCERAPWMQRTEPWVRRLVASGIPVLGICFGHQLLARALGGSVEPNPRGLEVGTVWVERLGDDPLLDGLPAHFTANCFHDDTVVAAPPGAVPLLRSRLEPHQCLRFGPRCYGVQFHPEFDGDVMQAYIRARARSIRETGLPPDRLLARVQQSAAARQVLRNFAARFVAP